MHIINIDHLAITYATHLVFEDLSWAIESQHRVGLVGPNGSGKSTLLKAIAGLIPLEAGTITRQRDVTVGYLPQEVELTTGRTLLDEALILPPALAQVEHELQRIEEQLGDPTVYNDDLKLARSLSRQEKLLEEYETLGGSQHTSLVREYLSLLGFDEDDYALDAGTLSGGQKKLVYLARLAAEAADALLLDEPDNHLDITAKRRLENFIHRYPGAIVIVSHDRYLLDEIVNQIAELDAGKLTIYHGNYTAYTTEKELARLRQQQAYVAQQKEIARIEAAIKRFELWASMVVNERHIRQARSRRKMLDRMETNGEIIEKVTSRRLMDLQINGWRGSNKALEINNLTMGFDDELLFIDLNLLILHGERVGLVGPNGAGKSVLFRLILNQLQPLEGEIKVGPSTRISYYAQEHQTLDQWSDRTPVERLRDVRPMSDSDAVAFIMKFAFSYEQTRQPIRTLSGGERSRLQLAAIMLEQPNLLLLDEPTNNLDIQSVEVLEQALEEFEGAVLTISHDRYFLDKVVDRIVELRDGELVTYTGGYTDYVELQQRQGA
jgi:ATP-binding cassette subfamily F protein 3